MAEKLKLKIEFTLTAEQRKLFRQVVLMEKTTESEACRLLLINHLNACRDAGLTGVLPRLPQEPKPLQQRKSPGSRQPPRRIVKGQDQYQLGI